MSGSTILAQPGLSTVPGPDWHIQGTGDFDGDGKTDILWRNDGGTVLVWFMSGSTILAQPGLSTVPGPDWHIQGTGDFDGQ
jgi:hypothetical protein